MTRDHKLIAGGALCGVAGATFGTGAWALGFALLCAGAWVIAMAGKAHGRG